MPCASRAARLVTIVICALILAGCSSDLAETDSAGIARAPYSRTSSTTDRARVRDIIDRARRRPSADHRTEDEILGYDGNGVPQA